MAPIFSVAGNYEEQRFMGWLLSKIVPHEADDLIVETRSAVFDWQYGSEVTECDHFSYFTDEEFEKQYVNNKIFGELHKWLT